MKAAAVRRLQQKLDEVLDPDRSLEELGCVAFSDIRRLFTPQGKLLAIKDWPEDIARAVSGVEVIRGNVDKGDGKFDDVVKIRLWEKGRSLENALKKHGHLTDKLEVSGDAALLARLDAGRLRAAERGK